MNSISLDQILYGMSYAEIAAFFNAMEKDPNGPEALVYARSTAEVRENVDLLRKQLHPDSYNTTQVRFTDEEGRTLSDCENTIRSVAKKDCFRAGNYPVVYLIPGFHHFHGYDKIQLDRKSVLIYMKEVLDASGRPWKILDQKTKTDDAFIEYDIDYEVKPDERDLPAYLHQVADLKNHRLQPLYSYHDPDTGLLVKGFIDDPESQWQRHSFPDFTCYPYHEKQ